MLLYSHLLLVGGAAVLAVLPVLRVQGVRLSLRGVLRPRVLGAARARAAAAVPAVVPPVAPLPGVAARPRHRPRVRGARRAEAGGRRVLGLAAAVSAVAAVAGAPRRHAVPGVASVASVAVGVASVAGWRGLVAVSVAGLGDVEVPVLPGHGGAVVPRPGPGPVPGHLLLHCLTLLHWSLLHCSEHPPDTS